MTSPVLFAYRLDGHGGAAALDEQNIADVLKDKELGWAHLDAENAQTPQWLQDHVPYLNPLVIEALLAKETRPRVVEYENGLMIILRGVNTNPDADPEDMVSLRMWIDEHQIITTRLRRLASVMDVKDQLEDGRGPKNSGEFLTRISSKLLEKMEPVITVLDDKTDDLEESVIAEPDSKLRHNITDLRRTTLLLRRYIAPQKEVMGQIRNMDVAWIKPMDKRRIQENYDRTLRYVEDLDSIRERAQIVKDELMSALSDKMNKNMYVLSIIAAIFLPLGFLTGLLGINVGGIPGADNPQAFVIFGGMLVALVAAQIVLFKKMKWF